MRLFSDVEPLCVLLLPQCLIEDENWNYPFVTHGSPGHLDYSCAPLLRLFARFVEKTLRRLIMWPVRCLDNQIVRIANWSANLKETRAQGCWRSCLLSSSMVFLLICQTTRNCCRKLQIFLLWSLLLRCIIALEHKPCQRLEKSILIVIETSQCWKIPKKVSPFIF